MFVCLIKQIMYDVIFLGYIYLSFMILYGFIGIWFY